MSTRRGILGTMTAGAALLAVKEIAHAKDKPNGGFGATASVSVNSGNDSGNQTLTYQENQAIITDSGAIALNQGNDTGGAQQQGAVVEQSSSAGSVSSGGSGTTPAACYGIKLLNMTNGQESETYIPVSCAPYYCQG